MQSTTSNQIPKQTPAHSNKYETPTTTRTTNKSSQNYEMPIHHPRSNRLSTSKQTPTPTIRTTTNKSIINTKPVINIYDSSATSRPSTSKQTPAPTIRTTTNKPIKNTKPIINIYDSPTTIRPSTSKQTPAPTIRTTTNKPIINTKPMINIYDSPATTIRTTTATTHQKSARRIKKTSNHVYFKDGIVSPTARPTRKYKYRHPKTEGKPRLLSKRNAERIRAVKATTSKTNTNN